MSQLLTNLAGAAGGAAILVLGAGPIPEFGMILQFSGLGALLGLIVALRAKRRFAADADQRWTIIARYTIAGAVVGALVALGADLYSI